MTAGSSSNTLNEGDPFADPTGPASTTERDLITEATLAVGENASLTLIKDALIVLDDTVHEEPRLCGLVSQKSTPTRTIPYFNILSATLGEFEITLRYAKPTSLKKTKSEVIIHTIHYALNSPRDLAEKWVAHLLSRAYGPAKRNKRIKVLINPFGGQGKAGKIYSNQIKPIFEAAECPVSIEHTGYMGHATEIAERLDIADYDVVACASGDGLPYEVFNGLGKKPNASEALRKIAVVQLPCGSGNAMCWNLTGTAIPSLAALTIIKGVRTPIDLVSLTQGNRRTLSFLSQSVGIVAESDLGTDNIRWMGDFRFTYGFLVRLFGQTLYPIDISVKTEFDDKAQIKAHYAREMAKRDARDGSKQNEQNRDEQVETSTALGLPPLRYGTVNDPLPKGWEPMTPYLNLGNFYCGNMCYMAADTPFFPASLPNDGMLDLVTVDGDIPRLKAIGMLLDVENNDFLDSPLVRYRKVSGIRVVPRFGWDGAPRKSQGEQRKSNLLGKMVGKLFGGQTEKEGYFSVDGERLPFEPFQLEVHRGLGTVLSRQRGRYEFEEGPKGWNVTQTTPTKTSPGEDMERPHEREL